MGTTARRHRYQGYRLQQLQIPMSNRLWRSKPAMAVQFSGSDFGASLPIRSHCQRTSLPNAYTALGRMSKVAEENRRRSIRLTGWLL